MGAQPACLHHDIAIGYRSPALLRRTYSSTNVFAEIIPIITCCLAVARILATAS